MRQFHHILTKTPLFMRVVSLYVVVIAIFIPITHTTMQHHTTTVPALARALSISSSYSGTPVALDIPRLGLQLSIIDGTYDQSTGSWTLTEDKAQYATITSSLSSTAGSTLIYGHNTDRVLMPTSGLEVGDELRVRASSGRTFIYTYSHDASVKPTDTSILSATSAKPQVILMTCQGWLSLTRRVMYFDFKEVA